MTDTTATLDEAIVHLEHATRLSPRNARYNAALGEAYLRRGHYQDAIAPLEMGFRDDAHPRTAYLLALTLLRCDQFRDAEEYATVALDEGDAFQRAYHVRARARLGRGDRQGAVADLWKALDLVPGDENYRAELGRLLVERAFYSEPEDRHRRFGEARHVLQLREPPESFVEEWRYLFGCCLLELGEAKAALGHFQRTTFPTGPEVAFRSGLCLAVLGRSDEADVQLAIAREDPALARAADAYLAALEFAAPDRGLTPSGPAVLDQTEVFGEISCDSTGTRVPSGPLVPPTTAEPGPRSGADTDLSSPPGLLDRVEGRAAARPLEPGYLEGATQPLTLGDDNFEPEATESLTLLQDLTGPNTALDPWDDDVDPIDDDLDAEDPER